MLLHVALPGDKWATDFNIEEVGDTIYCKFPFNLRLKDEIKFSMEGARWDNDSKTWTIKANSLHNKFRLDYLTGKKPYTPYDSKLELVDCSKYKGVYPHQIELTSTALQRKRVMWAAEMGTGKTLSAIMAMEMSGVTDWWWVGTKSSLRAVQYELLKWGCSVEPRFQTYDSLARIVESWEPGVPPPHGIVFDESHKLKTFTSQRSRAARHISHSMLKEHGNNSYVILMTGTPSPKDPTDWYNQCETACPGFIREGDQFKFKNRLCIMRQKNGQNGVYKEVVTWLNDKRKCAICGEFKDHINHDPQLVCEGNEECHVWVESVNEIENLYKRIKGLVVVKFKKDVLKFLPEKIFEVIECKPTPSIMRTAKLIAQTAKSAAVGLSSLRELSDGFQYIEEHVGYDPCQHCLGTKECDEYFDPAQPDVPLFSRTAPNVQTRKITCISCEGSGQQKRYERKTQEIPCPKEDVLEEVLDRHEEVGRLVVYAGFTGSIDRCVRVAKRMGWDVIRADGRGWAFYKHDDTFIGDVDYVRTFQDLKEDFPRVVFIGHPGSAGVGLTLTASPSIFYYSNDFSAENRIQSMDRIHRPGMDLNRGATIIDCFHLPTDRYVKNNLDKKQDMQNMTMGDFSAIAADYDGDRVL